MKKNANRKARSRAKAQPGFWKKNWKLLLGILCVVGGVGNAASDLGAALFGLALGALLLFLFVRERKENAPASQAAASAQQDQPSARLHNEGSLSSSAITSEAERPASRRSRITLNKIDPRSERTLLMLQDFVVLDVETTGLNHVTDKIVEIAVITVQDGAAISHFSTLVNPERYIPAEASAINHIFDADVKDAPTYDEIAGKVAELVCGKTVIGHNVIFDLHFVQQLLSPLGVTAEIIFADTCSLSRLLLPELPNHKLETVTRHLGISDGQSHRALQDTRETMELFFWCQQEMERRNAEVAEKRKQERLAKKQEYIDRYSASPLFQKNFVFTGEFSIPRQAMIANLEAAGGLPRTQVNSHTDYLVVGDVSKLPGWALDRKLNAAKAIAEKNGRVQLIAEHEFFAMVSEARHALSLASQ